MPNFVSKSKISIMKPTVKTSEIAGFEPDGTPISNADLVKSVLKGSREAKAGKKVSFDELKTELLPPQG